MSMANVVARAVPHPNLISKYFKSSITVDAHNQTRQGFLALEQYWVTRNCWFCIATTFIGIDVTDAWKGFKHGLAAKHANKKLGILGFTERLLWEMVNGNIPDPDDEPNNLSPPPAATASNHHCAAATTRVGNQPPASVAVIAATAGSPAKLSSLSASQSARAASAFEVACAAALVAHTLWYTEGATKIQPGAMPKSSKPCRKQGCCGASGCNGKTALKCLQCDTWYCGDTAKRNCWSNHINALTKTRATSTSQP